jgi:hypothetical protein
LDDRRDRQVGACTVIGRRLLHPNLGAAAASDHREHGRRTAEVVLALAS